jgi:hypothetical protein
MLSALMVLGLGLVTLFPAVERLPVLDPREMAALAAAANDPEWWHALLGLAGEDAFTARLPELALVLLAINFWHLTSLRTVGVTAATLAAFVLLVSAPITLAAAQATGDGVAVLAACLGFAGLLRAETRADPIAAAMLWGAVALAFIGGQAVIAMALVVVVLARATLAPGGLRRDRRHLAVAVVVLAAMGAIDAATGSDALGVGLAQLALIGDWRTTALIFPIAAISLLPVLPFALQRASAGSGPDDAPAIDRLCVIAAGAPLPLVVLLPWHATSALVAVLPPLALLVARAALNPVMPRGGDARRLSALMLCLWAAAVGLLAAAALALPSWLGDGRDVLSAVAAVAALCVAALTVQWCRRAALSQALLGSILTAMLLGSAALDAMTDLGPRLAPQVARALAGPGGAMVLAPTPAPASHRPVDVATAIAALAADGGLRIVVDAIDRDRLLAAASAAGLPVFEAARADAVDLWRHGHPRATSLIAIAAAPER